MQGSDVTISILSILALFISLGARFLYSHKNIVKIAMIYSISKIIATILGGITSAKVIL